MGFKFGLTVNLLFLSGHNEKGTNSNNQVTRPLRRQTNWKEQLDPDPPIHFLIFFLFQKTE